MYTAQQIKAFINSDTRLPDDVSVRLAEASTTEDFIKLIFINKKDNRFYRAVKVCQREEGLTVKVSNVYDHTDMYDYKRWLVLSPDDLFDWFDYFLPQTFSYWNHPNKSNLAELP